MSTQFDRECDALDRAYERGLISLREYNEELRELQRSYHEAASEAIREAGEREAQNW